MLLVCITSRDEVFHEAYAEFLRFVVYSSTLSSFGCCRSEKFYELLVPGTLIIPWIIGPLLNYILNLPALLALVLNLSPLGLPADLRSTPLPPAALTERSYFERLVSAASSEKSE